MAVSQVIATYLTFYNEGLEDWQKIITGAITTTVIWIIATFFTRPTDEDTLRSFYQKISPGGPGWEAVISRAAADGIELARPSAILGLQLLCVVIGITTVYAALFATGSWIYGQTTEAIITTVISVLGAGFLLKAWSRIIN